MKNPIFWISVYCSLVFLNLAYKAWCGFSTHSWRKISATVHSVSIDGHDQGDADIGYSANAEYSYKIDGNTFTSSRLTYSDTKQLREKGAIRLLQGLRVGSQIDVFYNPSRPAESVNIKGVDTSSIIKLCIYGVISLITAVLASNTWHT